MIRAMIDRLTGFERITLGPQERMLVIHKGTFDSVLGPGEHRVKRRNTERHLHDVSQAHFSSPFEEALLRDRPDLAAALFRRIEAGPDEAILVLRDGRPFEVIGPDTAIALHSGAGDFETQPIALTPRLEVAPELARRLAQLGAEARTRVVAVPEGHVGLVTVNGAARGRVETGVFTHFDFPGHRVLTRLVDMRLRTHEVLGQEILTRDRVTIRVNLVVDFRVTDPELAVSMVADFMAALHRAVQLAFRRTLGAMTLDQLLADKVAVDGEAAETVRRDMAKIGLEVQEIALKDVILPGEMRHILNRVVEVEKEAEANVIRRREETNATRSLLNTAKVMAENPVMLRLRELEALEAIAEKVDRLTVHNGTRGLLDEVVQLRD